MKKLISLLIIPLVLSVFSPASAEEATITEITVVKAPTLKVSFRVKDAFTREIEEAVRSGLPTSFNFIIVLDKVNSVFPDTTIGRWEYKHTVKYDSLRDEYDVSMDETGEALKTKDFGEMKRLMTTSKDVTVAPAHLVPGQPYELKLKAELHTIDLPFLLNYMLFFVKFFEFETSWHIYAFTP